MNILLAVSSEEKLLRRLNEFESAETVSTSGKGMDAKWRVLGSFVGVQRGAWDGGRRGEERGGGGGGVMEVEVVGEKTGGSSGGYNGGVSGGRCNCGGSYAWRYGGGGSFPPFPVRRLSDSLLCP